MSLKMVMDTFALMFFCDQFFRAWKKETDHGRESRSMKSFEEVDSLKCEYHEQTFNKNSVYIDHPTPANHAVDFVVRFRHALNQDCSRHHPDERKNLISTQRRNYYTHRRNLNNFFQKNHFV